MPVSPSSASFRRSFSVLFSRLGPDAFLARRRREEATSPPLEDGVGAEDGRSNRVRSGSRLRCQPLRHWARAGRRCLQHEVGVPAEGTGKLLLPGSFALLMGKKRSPAVLPSRRKGPPGYSLVLLLCRGSCLIVLLTAGGNRRVACGKELLAWQAPLLILGSS